MAIRCSSSTLHDICGSANGIGSGLVRDYRPFVGLYGWLRDWNTTLVVFGFFLVATLSFAQSRRLGVSIALLAVAATFAFYWSGGSPALHFNTYLSQGDLPLTRERGFLLPRPFVIAAFAATVCLIHLLAARKRLPNMTRRSLYLLIAPAFFLVYLLLNQGQEWHISRMDLFGIFAFIGLLGLARQICVRNGKHAIQPNLK